jgi:sugar phosphate isomerase/epimerase
LTPPRPFGVSTHLIHGQRLAREHLVEIGAHGFDLIELFATRTHFDYHSAPVIADLQAWLADARLELHSVHAPIVESFTGGQWGPPLNIASPNAEARQRALGEAELALQIARRIPYRVLVVHLGVPKTPQSVAGENSRDAARRSIEVLQRQADPLGVTVAVEVLPNDLSRPAALVYFVEQVLEDAPVGICFDFGHAHMSDDVVDAIETVSEHLIATHVHDNRGRSDDHLLPFEGTIDWPAAMIGLQKVGYEGPLVFEIPKGREIPQGRDISPGGSRDAGAQGTTKATLQKLRDVRQRIERILIP